MKLWDIVKKIGGSVVAEVVPGGGLLVDAVNAFLPESKRLDSTTTGAEMEQAVADLPPPLRAQVFERQFDVQLEEIKQQGDTIRAMLHAEQNSRHTTRPYIAKHSFHVVAIVTLAIVAGWLLAVQKSPDPLENIISGWSFVLALLVPFVAVLRAYFGLLSREHQNRLDAVHGATNPSGLGGIIKNIFSRG